MNKTVLNILAVGALSVLATSIAQAKVTQQEAEKLVLKKYPAYHVVSSSESTVNGKAVWEVKCTTIGGNLAQRVYVDEETGKVTK